MANREFHIGSITLTGDRPYVIAPFTDQTPHQELTRACEEGLDLLEARVDQFRGNWRGSESERLLLFSALLPKVEAVDIELSSSEILALVVSRAQKAQKKLIISFHDFKAVPSLAVLSDLVERAKEKGADLIKIAATPHSTEEVQTLASATIAKSHHNLMVIGMGPEGLKTRLLLPALGSLLTFAYIDQPTAPGQLSVRETCQLLRALYPSYLRQKPAPTL
jgi:3-dehydroquinate dehydratase-1